eukprot:scaffold4716_cov109-Isochrysis_galbana.AAC.15
MRKRGALSCRRKRARRAARRTAKGPPHCRRCQTEPPPRVESPRRNRACVPGESAPFGPMPPYFGSPGIAPHRRAAVRVSPIRARSRTSAATAPQRRVSPPPPRERAGLRYVGRPPPPRHGGEAVPARGRAPRRRHEASPSPDRPSACPCRARGARGFNGPLPGGGGSGVARNFFLRF